ncbi:hypothetical protein Ancab_034002 [Ancistrocladus abbreviatus]
MASHGSPVQFRREPRPCGLSTANCAKRSHGLSVRRGKSTQRHNRKWKRDVVGDLQASIDRVKEELKSLDLLEESSGLSDEAICHRKTLFLPELGGFLGVLISSLQPSPVASGVEGFKVLNASCCEVRKDAWAAQS